MIAALGRRRGWLAAAAVGALSGFMAWPLSAQPSQGDSAAQAQHLPHPSAIKELRKEFRDLVATSPEWKRGVGKRGAADMFRDFLEWPGNPYRAALTVRLTFPGGVGPVIGTLTVRNGEIMVGGRKEGALFIEPDVRGLPQGRYAFHVHENPDCGSAVKDGRHVPGLAAGGHLWASGTGSLSGKTFSSHLGHLPNLQVDADGTARTLVVGTRLTLADVVGRSFIIHANEADDSDRLACAAFE